MPPFKAFRDALLVFQQNMLSKLIFMVALQDTLCTAGVPTTAGSAVLDGFKPSFDATSVTKLKAAGASILGKVNCDQFAMGSTTETSSYHVSSTKRRVHHGNFNT